MTRDDGGTFSILSIDLALLNGIGLAPVNFVGTTVGLSFVTYGVTVTRHSSLTTFIFPSDFTDLIHLEWRQEWEFHQFDNLVLEEGRPVPEPSMLFLWSAGVGGVFLRIRSSRRRMCALKP